MSEEYSAVASSRLQPINDPYFWNRPLSKDALIFTGLSFGMGIAGGVCVGLLLGALSN